MKLYEFFDQYKQRKPNKIILATSNNEAWRNKHHIRVHLKFDLIERGADNDTLILTTTDREQTVAFDYVESITVGNGYKDHWTYFNISCQNGNTYKILFDY